VTRGWRTWLIILGTWTALGLLESAKAHYAFAARGRPSVWWWPLVANMPWWYGWAALTPAAFWIAARWPVSGSRRGRAVAIHVVASAVFAMVHLVGTSYLTHWVTGGRAMGTGSSQISAFVANYFVLDLVTYAAIVGAYFALDYARRWHESTIAAAQLDMRATRLELGLADARLQALRMELNPHFLFNTLNAISGLVRREEKDAAVSMLARLGDLLRLTLDRNLPQEIALDDELMLLQRYLDIEQARFGTRLVVKIDVPPSVLQASVPTLVCQPLVENAVRHGVGRRSGPVSVSIRAMRDATTLTLQVCDTGRGLGTLPIREGIGLSNTRQRLRELYGEAASLELDNGPDGGAVATIRLPFRAAMRTEPVPATA